MTRELLEWWEGQGEQDSDTGSNTDEAQTRAYREAMASTCQRRDVALLTEPIWQARADAHRERLGGWVQAHLARRARGAAHPVLDFLFTYYSEPPNRLLRWHGGAGTALLGESARDRLAWPLHVEIETPEGQPAVGLDVEAFRERRGAGVRFISELLTATAARPGHFACFGMHEWAMVYRSAEPRHGAVPLRLGSASTDAVVQAADLTCTHADAYRFFTPQAAALSRTHPRREDQIATEQPGCLHAGMDLYKWAYKLSPAVPGELLADCFELAVDIRTLDMRASPYDLRAWGYDPVPVESPEGRAAYVAGQRTFAGRAARLRAELLEVCRRLLA